MLRRPPSPPKAAEKKRQRRRLEQQRCRALKRKAGGIAYVPCDAGVIELFIACGWLEPGRADDPREIDAAYYRAVFEAARDLARRLSGP
jgi:hypothetical protein